MNLFTIIIISIAGIGAGIITGLVGASAAVIVTPLLVTFLNYDPYIAISISLATDVFASTASSITYARHKNIDLKNGLTMALSAIIGAQLGSYLSSMIPSNTLGNASGIVTLIMGINFFRKHKKSPNDYSTIFDITNKLLQFFRGKKFFSSILFGFIIGIICGIAGAGGGLMLLLILSRILGFPIKTAIGTSVLIMTFTALSGSAGHFIHMSSIPLSEVLLAGFFSIIGAKGAALFANKSDEKSMYKIIGLTFIVLGLILIVSKSLLGL
ncbi:sulfite exporter TauE/SafE family protein [Clostridium sp. DL1XJH146]